MVESALNVSELARINLINRLQQLAGTINDFADSFLLRVFSLCPNRATYCFNDISFGDVEQYSIYRFAMSVSSMRQQCQLRNSNKSWNNTNRAIENINHAIQPFNASN